jgi:hypothetical protein
MIREPCFELLLRFDNVMGFRQNNCDDRSDVLER